MKVCFLCCCVFLFIFFLFICFLSKYSSALKNINTPYYLIAVNVFYKAEIHSKPKLYNLLFYHEEEGFQVQVAKTLMEKVKIL